MPQGNKPAKPPTAAVRPTPARSEPPREIAPPQPPRELAFVPPAEEAEPRNQLAGEPPVIDDERVAAHGIRKLAGKHLVLYTDLPAAKDIDELPAVFDAAVPQWQAYFEVPDALVAKWQIWGYLIKDKAKFQAAGLFPANLPDFPHGFQRGREFWLYEQPTAYYRRHLMLHEGTHAAMFHWLQGAGPPWYCEGMAELFGTHRWADGQLTTRYNPRDKDEVPGWGRIKLIKDAYASDQALLLADVLKLPIDAHRQTEAYAWSWAAANFLENHPHCQGAFRALKAEAKDASADFSKSLLKTLQPELRNLVEEWQLFLANCEYGYDVAAHTLDTKPTQPLPPGGAKATIAANHAWQSTGLALKAGETYRITATGRYLLAKKPQAWPCEPGGVTLRYHRGRPLGELQAAVRDDAATPQVSPLLTPTPIGLVGAIRPQTSGTLWLKINEHDAEYADNEGELAVKVERERK